MSTEMVKTNADVRRHELLADVAEQTATRLIEKHAVDEEIACDIGNDLADFLSEHWKGQNIYMNADTKYKFSKRDQLIFERMERGNAHELAKELNLSYVRVYQIYKRCLEEARARRQPGLFEELKTVAQAKLSTASEMED